MGQLDQHIKQLDLNCATKESLQEKAAGIERLDTLLNQISEAVVGIKNESEEKLGRLPLLEKKMNKWIKIFENSEKENINKGTEQAKK